MVLSRSPTSLPIITFDEYQEVDSERTQFGTVNNAEVLASHSPWTLLGDDIDHFMARITLPDNEKYQVRRIRNIDIFSNDLDCLLEPGHKVPSTIIDAYGATLVLESEEDPLDYAILPSYLGVVVPNHSSGSFEDIQTLVSRV